MIGQKVVITTDENRRGVFFGTLADRDDKGNATLLNAQMAVYWSKETRGVIGLAASGPMKGSRITDSVPRLEIDGVTAVMLATDEAAKRWEDRPWS